MCLDLKVDPAAVSCFLILCILWNCW
jgi:hypothetical protein